VKWVIVAILVILVAPTIAKRLETLDPDKQDNQADPATVRKRGIVYRSVARFGLRRVFWVFVLILLILAVGVYLLIHSV
jgi:Trk-type K+ transport system membrane component